MASMVILMYFIISLVQTLIYTAVIYIRQTTDMIIMSYVGYYLYLISVAPMALRIEI